MLPRVETILERLNALSSYFAHTDCRNDAVSDWSVGQQAEHVIRATSAFTVMILRNRPTDGSQPEVALKHRLLERGSIPRGIAKAPEPTLPGEHPSPIDLDSLLLKCRNRVERLSGVDPQSVAIHPYLGEMKRDEILQFLIIHLDHHLSIIKDIMDARSNGA